MPTPYEQKTETGTAPAHAGVIAQSENAESVNLATQAETAVSETGASESAEKASGSTFTPPTIFSETVGHVGSFEIRNTLLMSWIAVIFLCVIAWRFSKDYKENIIPSTFQNAVESVIEGIYNFFHTVTQDDKQTKQFFGVCATIFLFIVVSNWFGLLPGVGSIGYWHVEEGHQVLIPLLRSAYSDVNMTMAIALISVVMTQVYGMANLKFSGYWGKFFVNPFRDPIGAGVGILELISEFSKIISFSFRLYGNIFAGEVLLAVIGFLVPYIAPLPFYGLELFVGLVQGLVFALLTLVFFKMGSTGHGEHGEGHAPESNHATT